MKRIRYYLIPKDVFDNMELNSNQKIILSILTFPQNEEQSPLGTTIMEISQISKLSKKTIRKEIKEIKKNPEDYIVDENNRFYFNPVALHRISMFKISTPIMESDLRSEYKIIWTFITNNHFQFPSIEICKSLKIKPSTRKNMSRVIKQMGLLKLSRMFLFGKVNTNVAVDFSVAKSRTNEFIKRMKDDYKNRIHSLAELKKKKFDLTTDEVVQETLKSESVKSESCPNV